MSLLDAFRPKDVYDDISAEKYWVTLDSWKNAYDTVVCSIGNHDLSESFLDHMDGLLEGKKDFLGKKSSVIFLIDDVLVSEHGIRDFVDGLVKDKGIYVFSSYRQLDDSIFVGNGIFGTDSPQYLFPVDPMHKKELFSLALFRGPEGSRFNYFKHQEPIDMLYKATYSDLSLKISAVSSLEH